MKTQNVINLIRYFVQKNDRGFIQEAKKIAKNLVKRGKVRRAQRIEMLLSSLSWSKQEKQRVLARSFLKCIESDRRRFFKEVPMQPIALFLPKAVRKEIDEWVSFLRLDFPSHTFLFGGGEGMGKSSVCVHIAQATKRQLINIQIKRILDKDPLVQQQNLLKVFRLIAQTPNPKKTLFLLDDLDTLLYSTTKDGTTEVDIRTMKTFTRCLDELPIDIVLLVTCNRFDLLDQSCLERFNHYVAFDCYSFEDKLYIAEHYFKDYLSKADNSFYDKRLTHKILKLHDRLPAPGVLKDMIAKAIATGSHGDEKAYVRHFYQLLHQEVPEDFSLLKDQGFTVREMEVLTTIPKSTIARKLQKIS